MPRISVVIPTYNADRYLKESIDSILNQTFQDFEIIIVDDGSSDNTQGILEEYRKNYSNIRVLQGPRKGISAALNMGIDASHGEYIARMDADDIALPQRFERQLSVMDSTPSLAVCGTWFRTFDETGFLSIEKRPTNPLSFKTQILFFCRIGHPTVMMRKAMLDAGAFRYDETLLGAEDFDLWKRISLVYDMTNIPEILLHYRMHGAQATGSISKEKLDYDRRTVGSMTFRNFQELFGITFPQKYLHIFYYADRNYSFEDLIELDNLFYQLLQAIIQTKRYDDRTAKETLGELICHMASQSLRVGDFLRFMLVEKLGPPKIWLKNIIKRALRKTPRVRKSLWMLKKAIFK